VTQTLTSRRAAGRLEKSRASRSIYSRDHL
jgi:hypothetical protein